MAELDRKMEVFKRNMKQRLIDLPTSFEDQSKLIKYLKVVSLIYVFNLQAFVVVDELITAWLIQLERGLWVLIHSF